MSLTKYRDPVTGEWKPVAMGVGATFTPSVSEDGTLSWSNDRDLPNPAPVVIKGTTPEKGVDYFTEEDKQEIAEQAAELVDAPSGSWNDLTDKPEAFPPAEHDHDSDYLKLSGGPMTGAIDFPRGVGISCGGGAIIYVSESGNLLIGNGGSVSGQIYFYTSLRPGSTYVDKIDIGLSGARWRNLYLSGNLSDGTNSVSIANIAKKSDIPSVPTLTTESWTFELEDGSTVTKAVYIG